jgi:heme/copper-type cytochrome/quinol oxidase subunit 2
MSEVIDKPESAEVAEGSRTPRFRDTSRLSWMGWSGFFLAVVQSVCSAFIALSGVRLLVGAVAFASALGVLKVADRLHVDAIRVPMMVLALVGSVVNLVALWQVWRLRKRGASAWRMKEVPAKKRRAERIQFVLAVLTIVLLVVEEVAHWKLQGRG